MPNPVISQISIPDGQGGTSTYDLKDAWSRDRLLELTKALYWIGVTTTELVDNVTTSPIITVGGESVTAKAGGIAQYNSEEFVYNGTSWQSLGSTLTGLGDLAYSDTASATYTPDGSITGTAVSVGSTTVKQLKTVGSMPTYSVSSEILTITAGSVPTGEDVTVGASGNATVTQGTFTGTAATITVNGDD